MKLYHYPSDAAEKRLKRIETRGLLTRHKEEASVRRILKDVQANGDSALIKYSRQFDAPQLKIDQLLVGKDEMASAMRQVDRRFKRALNRAANQIESFHVKQRQTRRNPPATQPTICEACHFQPAGCAHFSSQSRSCE